MPFEIPQQEPVIKTRFSDVADAMLRGCAITKPMNGAYCLANGMACALGAWLAGTGQPYRHDVYEEPFAQAYIERYHSSIAADNDSKRFTREQIAERIRSL